MARIRALLGAGLYGDALSELRYAQRAWGGNPALDPTQVLRDYVVQVDPKNPDLFLGKAYGAFGPLRIPTNFFILERFRVGLTDYVKR